MNIPDWLQFINPASWAFSELIGQPKEHEPTRQPRVVAATANVNPLDDVILVSGNTTMTLETAVGSDGRKHTFIKTDSGNTMTVACTGAETIDGAATLATGTQYAAFRVVSDGTNWKSDRTDLAIALGTLGTAHGGTGATTLAWATFTATRTGWTDVGTPTVTARKCQIGNVCYFQVKVVPGTTTATVAGTSYVALPITAAGIGGDASMVDLTTLIGIGNCAIDSANSRVYVPTQTATGDTLNIAGWYEV